LSTDQEIQMKITTSFKRLTITVLFCALCTLTCSKSTDPVDENPVIALNPSAGTPGTPVEVLGLDASTYDMSVTEVTMGGEVAPVIKDNNGHLVACIPLFLDPGGVSNLPSAPVDVVIMVNGTTRASIDGALTVNPLPSAPGSAQAMAAAMSAISTSLEKIVGTLGAAPGLQEQYLEAAIASLDSLLLGSSEYSLSTVLVQLQNDSALAGAIDGMLEATGLLAATEAYSAKLQALVDQLPAATSGGSARTPEWEVGDESLAIMMQFYVIAHGFGQQVIAETGRQYSESLGLMLGVVGIATTVPYAAAVSVILAYLDYVVNKIIVGLLPAHLDAVSLTLASDQLEPGEKTQATITLSASNERPTLTLQQLIGNILTLLGASGSPSSIQSFRDVLENTAAFFLNTMQSIIASYAGAHPELNLDVDVAHTVPHMSWQATAVNPILMDCKTFTNSIVLPVTNELNWEAQNQQGLGRIYVMPSLSADARLLPEYYGGAFGLETTASPTVSVRVGGDLVLDISAPMGMNHGENTAVTVRAGYELPEGGVDWSPDIALSFEIAGGSIRDEYGMTDSNGDFSNSVTADDPETETIEIIVEALGDGDTYGVDVVKISVGRGLQAYYSNGVGALEGPIYHGWSNSCTDNNMYQGVCTQNSPVDWARGGWEPDTGFYVSWTGFLYAPVTGSYGFGAWVDGDVFVEVNGIVVGDLDTSGGGYSGYVYLEGETWVPVFLYFETNGGSNNMGLRWTIPGATEAEYIPRKYLTNIVSS
jgi:hypothetical protein